MSMKASTSQLMLDVLLLLLLLLLLLIIIILIIIIIINIICLFCPRETGNYFSSRISVLWMQTLTIRSGYLTGRPNSLNKRASIVVELNDRPRVVCKRRSESFSIKSPAPLPLRYLIPKECISTFGNIAIAI